MTAAVAALLLLLLSSTAAASSSSTSGTRGAGADLTTLRVSLNFDPPGPEDEPVFYAIKHGYYAQQGLKIDLVPTKGSLFAVNNVDNGVADIGVATGGTAMLAIGKGASVRIVGTLYGGDGTGLYVDKSTGVTSLAQMVGHSVIETPGSAVALLLPGALAAAHVDQNSVKLLNVTSSALISTYDSGQGDSVATTISAVKQIQPFRKSTFVSFASVGASTPGYSIFANPSKSLFKQHANLIAAFLRATYKGELGAISNAKAAAQALKDLNPADDINLDQYTAGFQAWHGFTCSAGQKGKPLGYPVPKDWANAAKLLAKYAGLTGSQAASRFETTKFFTSPAYKKAPVSTAICH